MTRSVREVVDTKTLAAALNKASITAPAETLRRGRDAVKLDRAESVMATMRDVGRVRTRPALGPPSRVWSFLKVLATWRALLVWPRPRAARPARS
jgi:hypothetical protein